MSDVLKPTLGSQLNLGQRLSQSLVGFWLLNEGSGNKVFDLSGNDWGETILGNTSWVAGKFGSALSFPGDAGDYVSLDASKLPSGDQTWSIWVNGRDFSSTEDIMSAADSGDGGEWMGFRPTSATNINWVVRTGATNYIVSMTVANGSWYLLTGTIKGTVSTAYLNGVLIGTAAPPNIPVGMDIFYLASKTQPVSLKYYDGLLDLPMIWNRALSASEIAELYLNSFIMFERMPIELWVGATSVGVPPVGQPTMRRWANIPHMSYLGRRSA